MESKGLPCKTSSRAGGFLVTVQRGSRRYDVVLPPCPEGPAPVVALGSVSEGFARKTSCSAGAALLAMIQGVPEDVAAEDEEFWGVDDEALARMEERLDAELGMDAFNDDTFGTSSAEWHFGRFR